MSFTKRVLFPILLFNSLQVIVPPVESANILFFSVISSYSHRVTTWPLAEALAEKGHNVTYISTHDFSKKNQPPNPKVFDYIPTSMNGWMDKMSDQVDIYASRRDGKQDTSILLPFFGMAMCGELLNDEEFVSWVKSVKMDLVVVDSLANECIYGAVHFWKAKVILYHTFSQMGYFPDSYGLPDESDWLPSLEIFPTEIINDSMTLWQRICNKLLPIAFHLLRQWVYFPWLEYKAKDKLGLEDPLNFEELEGNTSIVFLNTHWSLEYPRSLPPHTVAIGGIALLGTTQGNSKDPLPKDIDTFLNKGNGFIYISFGSWADFTRFDEHIKQAFIQTLRQFGKENKDKLQFIWKVSNESLIQEFPEGNVFISKWLPQQKILQHPKIKGYVTQTGLISMHEAVFNSVPLICFPILAEQDYNAAIAERKGFGVKLEVTRVTQDELEGAIKKIVHDSKYQDNVKKISKLFKERPQSPLETALWWSEFVLKHSPEELKALRPLGVGQSWWKKRGVDVWVILFLFSVVISTLVGFLTWKLIRKCCRSSKTNVKSNKKVQ